MYKLNRTIFKAGTVEETNNHADYYKSLPWKERFKISLYLNSIAFKLVGTKEGIMDKNVFNVRSRN
ncbi:hypothetical protein BH10BAC1_BH10BAC1_16540 [soil metagenome]